MARGQIPPHNLRAEASMIGAMMLAKAARYTAVEMNVTAEDFYKPAHQHIFATVVGMHFAMTPIDAVTVADQLHRDGLLEECGGMAYLMELLDATPAISNATRYGTIVQDASTLRRMIATAADISDLAYSEPGDVPAALAEAHGLIGAILDQADQRLLHGYYADMATLDAGGDRDESQPWIAHGVLRRHQRMLVVARAGIGKSVLLRQLALCCENGVHPYTGQATEKPRRALVVELEAGDWDITASMRDIMFALQRIKQTASVFDLARPALLHRPGGVDIRSPQGYATIEAAIRRTKPELVVMGPVKYLSLSKAGENYEVAALNLMGLLNGLLDRYDFALVMEVHFSRGDHGSPGGSERWVDWPDVGFGIHPPNDDATAHLAVGMEMTVKQFRTPRDSGIWLPSALIRGADYKLPWSVEDRPDPYRRTMSVFASRYGGMPQTEFTAFTQGEF